MRDYDMLTRHVAMVDTDREKTAIEFVFNAHGEQVDKTGHPYQEHLFRVAKTVEPNLRLIAYAHDVLEDTKTNEADLYNVGFTPWEVNILKLLTHHPNEPNGAYLSRVYTSEDAVRVKIADLMDNISRNRMDGLDQATRDRLYTKYYKALLFLADVSQRAT